MITGLVRNPSLERCAGVKYTSLELSDYDQFSKHVGSCDVYVPLVWSGTRREDRESEEINEVSYRFVMESIRQALAQGCKKIVIPGTCAEFAQDGVPVDEWSSPRPQSPYGYWKYQLSAETERLCRKAAAGFHCLRMFSVYGMDDDPNKMFNRIWNRLLANVPIEMTEGWQVWSFLHVDDAAKAFEIAILNDSLPDGYYHLAAGEHRCLRSFVEDMKRATKSMSELHYGAIPYTEGHIPHTIFLSRKAGGVFPWNPKITFAEGIKRMRESG